MAFQVSKYKVVNLKEHRLQSTSYFCFLPFAVSYNQCIILYALLGDNNKEARESFTVSRIPVSQCGIFCCVTCV